jgi:hypothetical protein
VSAAADIHAMDRFKVLQIVWAAMLAGVVMLATVAYLMLTALGIEMPGLPPVVIRVAAPAAFVMIAAALFLRRKLLEAIPAGATSEERSTRYQAAVISSTALIEGCGIFVIVLSLVAGEPRWIPTAAVITILMMVVTRPRREEMRGGTKATR